MTVMCVSRHALYIHSQGLQHTYLRGLWVFSQLGAQPKGAELCRTLHQGVAPPHEHITDV